MMPPKEQKAKATNGHVSSPPGHQPKGGRKPGKGTDAPPLPPEIHQTDAGNAQRLAIAHGRNVHYVKHWGQWFLWNGKFWVQDETLQIEWLAKQVIAQMYADASQEQSDDKRKALVKWALESEDQKRIYSMVRSAQSIPGITVSHDRFNADPWLLNVQNGILDLKTGTLRQHDRDALISKFVDTPYLPDAKCPTWLAFLKRIMAADEEMIAFIQRAVGYTLTGTVREKCLFFMHGAKGDNGKSTFVETILLLLGNYTLKAPIEMLMAKYGNPGIPNDVAKLPGKRFVVTSEVEQGRRLNESLVKDLTGMDTITARFMRQEWFSFLPTHKLWIYGNHKPVIKGRDGGIWNRIRLIPFEVQIPKEEQDQNLPAKLAAELPGILAWAVRGCLDWQQSGLDTPPSVAAATNEYRKEMDIIPQFIESECNTGSREKVYDKFSNLFAQYEWWCKKHGEIAMSGKDFGNALTDLGFLPDKGAGNKAIRRGIAVSDVDNGRYEEMAMRGELSK